MKAKAEELKKKFTKQQLAERVALLEKSRETGTEDNDHLTDRELQVLWISGYYKAQGREPGRFYTHLINAFFAADRHNHQRLREAFPTTALAHENYMKGELKEKYDLPED